ncbi:MAG: hypothetical protein IPM52_10575 [Bacteroidetes bacterium]|nr:hypothetical protein [Bacteroidota bacterium]
MPVKDTSLPTELKRAFYHLPGSYWILEEQATGAFFRDSVYVLSSRIDTVDVLHPGSREAIARKEVLKVRVAWPFYGMEYEIVSESSSFCPPIGANKEPCHYLTIEFFHEGKSKGRTRMYYYPAHPDGGWPVRTSGLDEPLVRIDTVMSSYQQKTLTFQDVGRVVLETDRSFQGTRSVRYISPDAGIIRWQFPLFGIDWQVVRYRVLQGS